MNGPMAFEVRGCSAVASSALAQDWVGRIRAGDEAAFNSASGGVTRNVEYYALAHASQFVRPGARRIDATSGVERLESAAFRNADDGSKALIIVNTAALARSFAVRWAGRSLTYALPAGSVATLTWQ